MTERKKRSSRKKKELTIDEKIQNGSLGFGLELKQHLSRLGYSISEIKKLMKSQKKI